MDGPLPLLYGTTAMYRGRMRRSPDPTPLKRLLADAAVGVARDPSDVVLPAYDTGCLTHLPPTVGTLLGVEEGWRAAPLPLAREHAGVRKVVTFLFDGIGQRRLAAQLQQDDAGFLELLTRYGGTHGVITSVSPSTTSVATTVLQGNGAAPAELGTLGFTQRMPRLGLVANMLFWRPAGNPVAKNGDLEQWGLVPEEMLTTPSLYRLLTPAGIRTRAFLPHDIARSPLSRMQLRGTETSGYVGWVDMFMQVAAFLEADDGPAYAYAYLPDFDGISHRDGPDGPSWGPLFEAVVGGLRRFLERLTPAARDGTLVLVTADHGHASTPPAHQRVVQALPGVMARMGLRHAGEPRHTYLYARQGEKAALLDAARSELGPSFLVLDGERALAAGLYGDPDRLHPEASQRVGDVVALARGTASLWDEADVAGVRGMHGALDAEEMLVPLVVLRADA